MQPFDVLAVVFFIAAVGVGVWLKLNNWGRSKDDDTAHHA